MCPAKLSSRFLLNGMIGASQPASHWSPLWRGTVFVLASTSLSCLLVDFYGLCPMRTFAGVIFVPAMVVLAGLAVYDYGHGNGELARAVIIGAVGGVTAAVAYDVFRLPFVFARRWGIEGLIPALNLFKVFPAFGAMLLRQPIQQAHYSLAADYLGWAYHFSNGLTIGVMYLALIGAGARRHWGWAVLLALGLEAGMLFTPYPRVFGIPVTLRFVLVTLAAHAVFGICLGLCVKLLFRKFRE